MTSFLQKNKKRLIYALALLFSFTTTVLMVSEDGKTRSVVNEYTTINKANADVPYSQSTYYGQGIYGSDSSGDDDGDDYSDSSGDSGSDSSGDVSDEYT